MMGITSRALTVGAVMIAGLVAPVPPAVLAAQQPVPQQRPAPSQIDVDRLPIDLQRIERQLRQNAEREEFDGLRLRYYVDVYGRAPRIQLFAPDANLTNGPVPWGAPTHRDMVEHVTPKEFRSPPMDLNALMRWLSEKIGK